MKSTTNQTPAEAAPENPWDDPAYDPWEGLTEEEKRALYCIEFCIYEEPLA